MTSITFIENPAFSVDFRQFQAAPAPDTEQKTVGVAQKLLKLVPVILSSFVKASWSTVATLGVSYRVNVLGFYGGWKDFRPPSDIYLAVLKTIFWSLGLVWGTVSMTTSLVIKELLPREQQFLNQYTRGMNVNHIRTSSKGIDVSHLEESVKIDDLLTWFKEINFDNPQGAGYMAPLSRKEGSLTYTKEELEKSLETFVNHVKNRVPFLGTPPGTQMDRLLAFYQQIENAVRFSIDGMNKKLEAFIQTNGAPESYNADQLKLYYGILEDKARIAIDLAIAGKHCGARFMGDAMTTYANMRGEEVTIEGSLEDYLVELLAQERYRIATEQIATHLGTDTHAFNLYMSSLGQILALPGTENMMEHLAKNLDRSRCLELFYKTYTVDFIIKAIQEKFAASQSFREKVYDWVKDQSGTWVPDGVALNSDQIATEMKEAWDRQEAHDPRLERLFDLLKESPQEMPKLIDDEGKKKSWDDFIEDLFSMEAVTTWRTEQFTDRVKGRKAIEAFKIDCKAQTFDETVQQKTKADLLEELHRRVQKQRQKDEKFNAIRKIMPLAKETIDRLIDNRPELKKAIEAKAQQEGANAFLDEMSKSHFPIRLDKPSLSAELMEWLLVSHGIFEAQKVGG